MKGRPLKKGLDCFPFSMSDIRFLNIRAVKYSFGFETLAFLLAELHEKEGYYLAWNERSERVFCYTKGIKVSNLRKVLDECFLLEIFDKAMYQKHGILTSIECQLVWLSVARQRTTIEFNADYILIDTGKAVAEVNRRASRKSKLKE